MKGTTSQNAELPRPHGPWIVNASCEVYADPWIQVVRDEVTRPDGQPGSYATIHLKSGVCVIAVDQADQVHLTKEFHYAVGRTTLEGASGGIEAGESPLESAQRELAEELGLLAGRWTHLGQVDPFTAAVRSTVDLYLAEDLQAVPKNPEGTELIEHVTMRLSEALELIGRSEITHAPTCVALLKVALSRQADSSPQ